MSITFKGMDKIQRQLKGAQQALKKLNGEITTLEINPRDPQSNQKAIRQMESVIDTRMSRYRNNPFVGEMVKATKENFRREIKEISNE